MNNQKQHFVNSFFRKLLLAFLVSVCLPGFISAQTLIAYRANGSEYDRWIGDEIAPASEGGKLDIGTGDTDGPGGAPTVIGTLRNENVYRIVLEGAFTYNQLAAIRGALYQYGTVNNNNIANTYLNEADLSALTIKDPENASWGTTVTAGNVGGFNCLFFMCVNMTKLTLPSTSINIGISMHRMCELACGLTTVINLDKFTRVTDFTQAFQKCHSLPALTLPKGSTASVPFVSAFAGCLMLTDLRNLEHFTTISDLHNAFFDCQRLEKITFNAAPTYSAGVRLSSTFERCFSLKKIENLERIQNCTTLAAAFYSCYSLPEINLPLPQVGTISISSAFRDCFDLVFINNLEQYTNVNSVVYTFNNCRSLTSIRLGFYAPASGNPSPMSSLNPNCLIYMPEMPENITPHNNWLSSGNGNVIVGTTAYGDIELQDVFTPGTVTTSDYLQYYTQWNGAPQFTSTPLTTGGSLRPCYYHCPVGFTLKSGATATYTRNFDGQTATAATSTTPMLGWQGFTLPFNATATGRNYLDPCDPGESQYAVAAYKQSDASGKLRFELLSRVTPQISANTPYIISVMPSSNNDVTFTIAGNSIPATPVTAAVYDYFDGNPTANPMKTNDLFNRWGFYGTFLPVKKTNFYQINKDTSDNYDKDTKTIASNPTTAANAAEVSLMSGSNPTHWAPFRAYFQAEAGAPATVTSLQLDYIAGVWDFNEWAGNGYYDSNPTLGRENYWSEPNNWTCGRLPYDYESVTYRSGAVDLYVDPYIPAAAYGTAGYARVMNITGIENKNLHVLAGASLELTDNLPNLGTATNKPIDLPNSGIVYVNSEERGSSLANGTLVIPTGAVLTATVYFDSKANNTVAGSSVPTEERKWQYFGPPVVESAARSTVFPSSRAWVRKYATTVVSQDEENIYYTYWNELADADKLTAKEGYEISVINGQDSKFAFTGTLVTTDQTKTITYNKDDRYAGQWVMSNPFTEGVEIKQITFGANLEQNVYLFNTGSSVEWKSGGYGGQGNAAGQYNVYPANTAGSEFVISSMQGFVVKMNTTTQGATGTITLPYASSKKNDMMKAPSRIEPLTYTAIGLFTGDNESLLDEMSIYTMENCSRSFENGYDGRKVISSNELAWIYSYEALPEGNEYLQVNAVADMNETLIAFKAQKEVSDYLLEFKHHNTEGVYDKIILVDRLDETETDVTVDGSVYRFTATNETNVQGRFLIRTSKEVTMIDTTQDDTSSKVYIYQSPDKTWLVINGEDSSAKLVCYNLSGQAVYQTLIAPGETIHLPQERFMPGVYVVKINNTSRKIIL